MTKATAVSYVGLSQDAAIDDLLSGYKWASNNLTHWFPVTGSHSEYPKYDNISNYAPSDALEQAAVTRALHEVEAVSGIVFTLTADVGGTAADLRFQNASSVDFDDHTGDHLNEGFLTYGLNSQDSPGNAGDTWFSGNVRFHDTAIGSAEYRSVLGSVVAALGLVGGHHVTHAGKSVLEYSQYGGAIVSGGAYGQLSEEPQSLMVDDIAALQFLYGANYNTNAGDSRYTFDPNTGQMYINGIGQGTPNHNYINRTIWDGGGIDTYDLSNYSTNLFISLAPGEASTFLVYPSVGNQKSKLYNARLDPHNANEIASLIENATGGSGNDTLYGNEAANTLIGGAGDDTLGAVAGLFADTLIGGTGNDVYYVNNAGSTLTVLGHTIHLAGDAVIENADEGTDSVHASVSYTLPDNVENLLLVGQAMFGTGNALGNSISGNDRANVLTGGTGNDSIKGNGGADTMIGGVGNDLYFVDTAGFNVVDLNGALMWIQGDTVVENPDEGLDYVYSSIRYALSANVEILNLTGTAAIDGTGNDLNNIVTGNAAVNTLTGMGGDDLLNGRAGADTMIGGIGNDTYDVDTRGWYRIGPGGVVTFVPGDTVIEAADEGFDTVVASINYVLGGNVEKLVLDTGSSKLVGTGNNLDNVIIGNAGANTLSGLGGDDSIQGGAGADTMIGGTGNDTYYVDTVGDVVTENADEGFDVVDASVGYVLPANVESLVLMGAANLDATGNAVANVLKGNAGNNILDGGGGADAMAGGSGADTYVVDNIADRVAEALNGGSDTVSSSVSYRLASNVENIQLAGRAKINATGNDLDNVLTGNNADNILTGGGGADIFAFLSPASAPKTASVAPAVVGAALSLGHDTAADFTALGLDHDIVAVDHAMFASFGDIMKHATQMGTDTVIAYDAQTSITLAKTELASLNAADFQFR